MAENKAQPKNAAHQTENGINFGIRQDFSCNYR